MLHDLIDSLKISESVCTVIAAPLQSYNNFFTSNKWPSAEFLQQKRHCLTTTRTGVARMSNHIDQMVIEPRPKMAHCKKYVPVTLVSSSFKLDEL
jgi:hypothetical protein